MKVSYRGVTDVGRKREANEDCFAVVPEDQLFVVADGMGGHAAGEVASRLAVSAIADFIASTRRDAEITWPYEYDLSMSMEGNRLKTAIRLANQRILDTISHKKDLEGMGTTLVGAMVTNGRAYVGHVGDSRAYLVRAGRIQQLTSDHSWVNEQVKLGFLSKSDASRHPFRNVVTRALGSREDVVVDVAEQRLERGDYLLLCSDGLNTMLSDEAIVETILESDGDVDAAARALVARANENGGEDNVTVILIKVDDGNISS
ncbi:MAG TPA: Stp1/IreP family PP2C-type Ser/Thr phosphatase [Candidatus Polarisedimenticolia bacterium]|nr:Stp1/IreP family PP2C-type Ser/Thr phosphatase [Candidatus Polarisedimenticolia bacterium]